MTGQLKRRRWPAVLAVLASFTAALAWWSNEGVVGDPPARLAQIANSAGRAGSPALGSGSSSSASSGGPLAGAGGAYRPGSVVVVFRATGDATIGAVAYRVQGGPARKRSEVPAPMTAAVNVPAGKHVGMVVQVAPNGHRATCSIAVNGVVKVTHTAYGPYQAVGCVY